MPKYDQKILFQEARVVAGYVKEEYNAAASAMGKGFLDKKFVLVGSKVDADDMEDRECPEHTEEAWEKYLKEKEEEEKRKQEEEEKKKLEEALQNLLTTGQ